MEELLICQECFLMDSQGGSILACIKAGWWAFVMLVPVLSCRLERVHAFKKLN